MSKQMMTVNVNGTEINVEFQSTVTVIDQETGAEMTARQAIVDAAEVAETAAEFGDILGGLGCDAEIFDCE